MSLFSHLQAPHKRTWNSVFCWVAGRHRPRRMGMYFSVTNQPKVYRLGNRSALEWVVDQYRVSTDARSGIVNDPNRPDDPEYIVRLLGQVVTVSVETVRLVRELAGLSIDQA